jgi:hypothetical protein
MSHRGPDQPVQALSALAAEARHVVTVVPGIHVA